MKKTVKKIEKKMSDLRIQNISLYFRDGKFYWTIKSCGFDSLEEAFTDAQLFCKLEDKTDGVNIDMATQTLPRRSGRYPWGSEKILEQFSEPEKLWPKYDTYLSQKGEEDGGKRAIGDADEPPV